MRTVGTEGEIQGRLPIRADHTHGILEENRVTARSRIAVQVAKMSESAKIAVLADSAPLRGALLYPKWPVGICHRFSLMVNSIGV